MSQSIHFDTLCIIYSVMLGFLWMVIQETYLFLVGTETQEKPKEKGFTNDGSVNTSEKQSDPLVQCSQFTNHARLSQDYQYLTNTGSTLSHHIHKSKKNRLVEVDFPKLNITACITEDPNYITAKLANTNEMEANSNTSFRALMPVSKDFPTTHMENLRIKKNTILQDFEKQITITIDTNLLGSNSLSQPGQIETSFDCLKQIVKISYFSSNSQMKLDDNQLKNLKKLANFIIVYFLQAIYVTPTIGHPKENCASRPLEISESSYETLSINRNHIRRSLFTVMVLKQRKCTTFSITKVDSIEQNKTKIKQVDIEKCEKVFKSIKSSMRKKCRKQRIMNNHRNGKAVFSSKHCVRQVAYFMATNEGYSRCKLHTEIARQLKPIKDQIEELRQSMLGFSVTNHQFGNKGIKDGILFIDAFDKANHKMNTIYTHPYENTHGSIQNKEITKVPSYSQGRLAKTEVEPRKLSPLAEMYIKLSKK